MDEQTQAISFANNYFALVDDLASGLENHLSENVVLDWFGRLIRGKKNVSAFMKVHKVRSRHMFADIVPSTGIDCETKRPNRKRFCCYQNCIAADSSQTGTDNDNAKMTNFHESSVLTREVVKDINQNVIDTKEIGGTDDDASYCLSEGDLSNLFKLDISSANITEIQQSINRIKLEEEMAPTVEVIKRERDDGDGTVVVETSAVKYVEAHGEIEFSRKFWKQDAWNAYFSATSNLHTWRRPCKLQIAYSTLTDQSASEQPRKNKNAGTRFDSPRTKLPSLEEINEISNRLIPNTSDFGGFLKSVDFFQDRKHFLENLSTEMQLKNSCTPPLVPKYVRNKLVFNKPRVDANNRDDSNKKNFVFNYQIHLIVYESNNKCRVNLMHEFERKSI